jgi:hypothetical protein
MHILIGDRDYDPFARRKTAPKHVINKLEEEKDKSLLKVPQSTSPGKSSLKADVSPNLKAVIGAIVDEDDFLDSVDISELEADLKA